MERVTGLFVALFRSRGSCCGRFDVMQFTAAPFRRTQNEASRKTTGKGSLAMSVSMGVSVRVLRAAAVLSILLALPLFAADPQAQALAEPIGVLHMEGPPIEIYSWSWGATQTVDSDSTGASAGKVQLQDFHFTKTVDKSSPSLFKACATGKHFPSATLTLRKSGKGQQDYMVVKFTDLIVSSYQTGGSAGDTIPMESIALNYASVEIEVP